MIKNSTSQYGSLTKLFHWTVVLTTIIQFYLVYQVEYFNEKSPLISQFIGLHKSLGISILFVIIAFSVWRHFNIKPALPNSIKSSHQRLAHLVQNLLLLLLLIMPISGYCMSTWGGRDIVWFGLFTWPALLAVNKTLAGISYNIHVYSSYLLLTLVSLHLAGNIKHYMDKNGVVQRMLPFNH